MSPEERRQLNELKQLVENMRRAEDLQFIESIARRLDGKIDAKIALTKLTDLFDVDTTGVSNGQVIKYNSTTEEWEPANDIGT